MTAATCRERRPSSASRGKILKKLSFFFRARPLLLFAFYSPLAPLGTDPQPQPRSTEARRGVVAIRVSQARTGSVPHAGRELRARSVHGQERRAFRQPLLACSGGVRQSPGVIRSAARNLALRRRRKPKINARSLVAAPRDDTIRCHSERSEESRTALRFLRAVRILGHYP